MKLLTSIKKQDRTTVIVIASIVLLIAFGLVYSILQSITRPVKPQINVSYDEEFSGETINVQGNVSADCPCVVSAEINNKDLELDEDGNFSTELKVGDEESYSFKIEAVASAKYFNHFDQKTEKKFEAERQAVNVAVDNAPEEWGEGSIVLEFKGEPNTAVTLDSVLNREISDATTEESEVLDTQSFELNDDGFASISAVFDTSYDTSFMEYLVKGNKDGFATFKGKFQVNNSAFNQDKINEEKSKINLGYEIKYTLDDKRYDGGVSYYVLLSGVNVNDPNLKLEIKKIIDAIVKEKGRKISIDFVSNRSDLDLVYKSHYGNNTLGRILTQAEIDRLAVSEVATFDGQMSTGFYNDTLMFFPGAFTSNPTVGKYVQTIMYTPNK